MISNLSKKALSNLAIPLAKNVPLNLATKATFSALDNFERKVSGQGAVRAGKGFTLFISKEMDDSIKIVESLEKSGILIVGAIETVKNEIKKKKVDFFEL